MGHCGFWTLYPEIRGSKKPQSIPILVTLAFTHAIHNHD